MSLTPRGMVDPPDTVTPDKTMPTPSKQPLNASEKDQLGQVPYRPRSKSKGLDSYVPQNLEAPIQTALDDLEQAVGNVDEFVADQLNFGSIEKPASSAGRRAGRWCSTGCPKLAARQGGINW